MGWLTVEPDGFYSQGIIHQQNLLELPSDLRPGVWVTHIHAPPIVSGLYIAPDGLSLPSKNGGSVEYTARRAGQTMAIQVPLGRWTVDQLLAATVFTSAATLFNLVRPAGFPGGQLLCLLAAARFACRDSADVPGSLSVRHLSDPERFAALAADVLDFSMAIHRSHPCASRFRGTA
jgi:hypothetical protein